MRLRLVFTFLMTTSLLLAAGPAWSQAPVLVLAGSVPLDGPSVFHAYCVACHGTGGKGDGPVAASLKQRPANLTTLSKRNHGQFPRAAIEEVLINGTRWQAHGSKEMPMWGPVFQAIDQNDHIAYAHIHNLVTYLESIQLK